VLLRVLVTGGAGFIGQHLAARLLGLGHQVRLLDSLLEQVHGPAPCCDSFRGELFRGDVRDQGVVRKAVRDVDAVYHLAAETGVGQSHYEIERYVSTNTTGTAVLLEAATAAGVRQLILASSRAVYGEGPYRCAVCGPLTNPMRTPAQLMAGAWEIACPACGRPAQFLAMREDSPLRPVSIYGLTKLQQEQLVLLVARSGQIAVTTLRLFNVYGPGQSLRNPYTGVLGTFFRRAARGLDAELYEDGLMLRDFVFVSDVVEALTASLLNDKAYGRVFNVATGQGMTVEALAAEVFQSAGARPNARRSGRYREGDVRHAVGDASTIAQRLGLHAAVSVSTGIRAFVSWARQNKADVAPHEAEAEMEDRQVLKRSDSR
jgi:dTDP-L-rhamnose 4-epimerase